MMLVTDDRQKLFHMAALLMYYLMEPEYFMEDVPQLMGSRACLFFALKEVGLQSWREVPQMVEFVAFLSFAEILLRFVLWLKVE